MALFDAYLMVDWSAAATPRQGADSIWMCRRDRDGAARVVNPATRLAAREVLLEWLAADLARGRKVLAGFDFPFGYPRGLAARLGLSGPPWAALWRTLAEQIEEGAKNANNRFEVAAALNRRVGSGPGPFWGCPEGAAGPHLAMTHHRAHEALGLAEKRIADQSISGPQPVWKLAGAGSAGSQALTGIPVVHWLRHHPALAAAARVWPFETGLRPPAASVGVVLAEIYPSLIAVTPAPGEVKDRAQVIAIAQHFAALDEAGRLGSCFAPLLAPADRDAVEAEESWILGVPTPYLRDPDAIYRQSFAQIRAATDLSHLPKSLHGLALRLVHACAEPAIVGDLVAADAALGIGQAALARGAPILVDAAMVAAGITRRRLPRGNPVLCFLEDERVPALAERLGTTRSAAAVELWRPALEGAVVAIGNAPTALFHLLEMIAGGGPRPALVLGFPVGFVGAAEAKAAIAGNALGLPYITLLGRRGGSAMAAAAVNALARDDSAA